MNNKTKQNLNNVLLWLAFTVLAIVLVNNVNAETLRDPTQIPHHLPVTANQQNGAPLANSGPTLQSVMLSADIQAAIIDGQKINLGGKFKGSKLTHLTESSATLRTAHGSNMVLKMQQSMIKKNTVRRVTTK